MKVLRPRANSSDAPTRLNSRSTIPIRAAVAGTLLDALEQRAGRLTEAAALPLFAATPAAAPPPEPPAEADALHSALAAIDPDSLTPREALQALYKLRELLSVHGANQ